MPSARSRLLPFFVAALCCSAHATTELSKEAEDALAKREMEQAFQQMRAAAEKRAQEQKAQSPEARHCPTRTGLSETEARDHMASGMATLMLQPTNMFAAEKLTESQVAANKAMIEKTNANTREMIATWNKTGCVMPDGRPRLSYLIGGYRASLDTEPDWGKAYELVKQFKARYPGEGFAQLAEPIYWSKYAWDARGTGYAKTVSEDGWRLFRERLTRAEQSLTEIKPSAGNLPVWYEEMIHVQKALGRDPATIQATFQEGVGKFPEYLPIYFSYAQTQMPKWGGSWEATDKLARWSADYTRPSLGNMMYTRIYWAAVQNSPSDLLLFEDTKASWPLMQQGFEDMMRKYPDSIYNLNSYASFACAANDRASYAKLRKQIGNAVHPVAWIGKLTPDFCDRKFAGANKATGKS